MSVLSQRISISSRGTVVLFLFAFGSPAAAQPFLQSFNPFPIVHGPDTLLSPFSGGIDQPVHQFVDIDLDGDYDLMVLDRDKRLTWYRNAGSPAEFIFVLEEIGFQNLETGSWFRFVDIDGDGDADLFANGPSASVMFFRNTGSGGSAAFVKELETVIDTGGVALVSEEISHPAFADPDGDGDLDFFSGNSAGTISYYENIGTASAFEFAFVTDTYQNIQIIGVGGTLNGPEDMKMESRGAEAALLHGAMALSFGDVDGDGDQDLLWGDFYNRSLYFLRNEGTPGAPGYVVADSTFPDEAPVQSDGFNMPSLVDLDADGDLDLVVGNLYPSAAKNTFHFYRNEGNSLVHDFQLESSSLLPSVDVGAASAPVFADIDNDGDRDLLIGSEDGVLTLYERDAGAFVLADTPVLSFPGLFNISPATADLDGDGDVDFIIGDFNGKLRLCIQTDTGFVQAPFSLDDQTFGLNAAPALADVDGDNLADLFVGTGAGRLVYFRNMGTTSQPDFILQSSTYLSIDVGDDARPSLADLDSDGDLDLILGAQDGSLNYYRNDGTPGAPAFQLIPGFFDGVTAVLRSAPAWGDPDGDGDPDLFLGNGKGGIYYYQNMRLSVSVEREVRPEGFMLSQGYPNPFNGIADFGLRIADWGQVELAVYDILGRRVATLMDGLKAPGEYTVQWDSGSTSSGVYFVRMIAGQTVEMRRIVLMR